MKKKPNVLASRIKKMMQADDEVGKIAHDTPVLIGQAMELLLQQLCKGASEVAQERGDKTLTPAHLKEFVGKEASLDFLKGIVEKAPELPDKSAAATPKKRQRAAKTGEEGGSARKRGKGKTKDAGAAEAAEAEPGAAEAGPVAGVKPEAGAVAKQEPLDSTASPLGAAPAAGAVKPEAGGGELPVQPGPAAAAAAAAAPALPSALLAGSAMAGAAGVEDEDDYDEE